jgi:hypothetical protein
VKDFLRRAYQQHADQQEIYQPPEQEEQLGLVDRLKQWWRGDNDEEYYNAVAVEPLYYSDRE